MKRYLSLVITIFFSFVILCSCSKANDNGVYQYLGNYSYTSSAVCMVYEPVAGEYDDAGNPCYGIQYREVTDLEGLLASDNTIMIYFYSSMSSEASAVTAAIEDLAQNYNGRLNVLMLDAMVYPELIGKYEIEAVPEFVLIKAGQEDKVFGSDTYEYWTVSEVVSWLQSNGV